MAIEITFLGTSCMQPTKTRNHSGFMLQAGVENILFDCGEGIQRQMRLAGLKPAKITRILISHWHGDHVFGLSGLLSSMGADKEDKTVKIYGPPGSKKYFEHLLKSFAAKDIIDFEVIEVKNGTIFENNDFRLEAQKLEHSTTCSCFGNCFNEKSPIKNNIKKSEKIRITRPNLRKLQQGEDVIFKGQKIK